MTASNELQAEAYKEQLKLRFDLGLFTGIDRFLVIPDPGGKRIGSGGSTIYSLLSILNHEMQERGSYSARPRDWKEIFENKRILIVHAGGDAKRLPPYGPCGKIFIPVPGENDTALGLTIIDRQLPTYLALPPLSSGRGQIVVTTGDVLLRFDPSTIVFHESGLTGIGSYADSEVVQNHGVFCPDSEGNVRLFLQKPNPEELLRYGALSAHSQALLDIGIMHLDSSSAVDLLKICDIEESHSEELEWSDGFGRLIDGGGLDFYREICCALGTETTLDFYMDSIGLTKSSELAPQFEDLFQKLQKIPFYAQRIARFDFLHFGTLRQLINTGNDLQNMDLGISQSNSFLNINNDIRDDGRINGFDSWIEGCRISAPVDLGGDNVLVGLDIEDPLSMPPRACMDMIPGRDLDGSHLWFLRCYSIGDLFNEEDLSNSQLCGLPIEEWIEVMEADPSDIWETSIPPDERRIWNGRFFPSIRSPQEYRNWMWLSNPGQSAKKQKIKWKETVRFSLSQMAELTSQEDFHSRRIKIRAQNIDISINRLLSGQSGFSALELAFVLGSLPFSEASGLVLRALRLAYDRYQNTDSSEGAEFLDLSRFLHTIGSAFEELKIKDEKSLTRLSSSLKPQIDGSMGEWLSSLNCDISQIETMDWPVHVKEAAFEILSRVIVLTRRHSGPPPQNDLRCDEIIWSRAPVRLDLGGGWSDTPPYSLENGGAVINAAVNLNRQAPIQVYARVIKEKEIRLNSIDHSSRVIIQNLNDLLDYREPTSQFGLAKAALALSGFSHDTADWPESFKSLSDMLEFFGGGIELTTLAAIPSGSGLGTSSIMGAVLISAINRLMGVTLSNKELFHRVLQLEQELTTGGGWQDQIGGVIDGVKMITTQPGMIPDPRIHYVPADVLDPCVNGGQTLLYYTGIRRLAKNILRDVVGSYLDRDRRAMDTLQRLHSFPPLMVEAMSRKKMDRFGELIDIAWNLNKTLDPDSSTPAIESILDSIEAHISGAKLLGAGGGGFLLIVCKSETDSKAVINILSENPPNDRARFFDFDISTEGLVVTVC
ncbi:L-fucokinase [Acidobacteriota bacterium]